MEKIILYLFVLNPKFSQEISKHKTIGVEQGYILMDLHSIDLEMPKTEWFLGGSISLSQPNCENYGEGNKPKMELRKVKGTNEISNGSKNLQKSQNVKT